jgi:hypothetical protein
MSHRLNNPVTEIDVIKTLLFGLISKLSELVA